MLSSFCLKKLCLEILNEVSLLAFHAKSELYTIPMLKWGTSLEYIDSNLNFINRFSLKILNIRQSFLSFEFIHILLYMNIYICNKSFTIASDMFRENFIIYCGKYISIYCVAFSTRIIHYYWIFGTLLPAIVSNQVYISMTLNISVETFSKRLHTSSAFVYYYVYKIICQTYRTALMTEYEVQISKCNLRTWSNII